MAEKKKDKFKILSWIVFAVAIVILAAITVPLITTYKDPAQFKAYIDSLGVWGFFLMLFVQIAQIIVALIPGEVVEFVAGALYGWFWGLLFCFLGILIGQTIIFKTVRILGRDFVEKVAGSEKLKKFSYLQNDSKLKIIVFLLFFIPGTPKDLLTYIVPLTKMKLREFLLITLVARIPSVVSSTYAGEAFGNQNYVLLAAVYAGILVVSLIGILLYRAWEKKQEKKGA